MTILFYYHRCHNSFNRYMVECELLIQMMIVHYIWVLIDTWWNVNNFMHIFNAYTSQF